MIFFQRTFLEVLQYREVLNNLLSRDLKIRYKRTSLGYVWSLLNPLLQLAVLGAVFSHFVGKEIANYPQYLFSGLVAWGFFQQSLVMSSTCFIENENFIKKIYLPKILFPLSKVALKAFDFLISLVALSAVGWFLGFTYRQSLLLLPLAFLSLLIFTLGVSLIIAVMTVFFRDVQYLLGVFLQLLYFSTPIIYPLQSLPQKFQILLGWNPLQTQILLFQKTLYFGVFPTSFDWITAFAVGFGFLTLGLALLSLSEKELVFRL